MRLEERANEVIISGTCDVDGRSPIVERGDLIDEVGGKSKRGT